MLDSLEKTSHASFWPWLDGIVQNHAFKSGDYLRSLAQKRFDKLGLPTRSWEAFKYFPLQKLYSSQFNESPDLALDLEAIYPYTLSQENPQSIVFINGRYCPELSSLQAFPHQVIISSLPLAMQRYGSLLKGYFKKNMQAEKDPFICLNALLQKEGVFIYLPPGTILKDPIQIVDLQRGSFQESVHSHSRLVLFAGAQAEASLIFNGCSSCGEESLRTHVQDFILDASSRIVCNYDESHTSKGAWNLSFTRATLKRDAYFKGFSLGVTEQISRRDHRIVLEGEGAKADVQGISCLDSTSQCHDHILVEHRAPHCESSQFFRSVLQGASVSSFLGEIFVESQAQKTNAFQLNNTLVLSDKAVVHSKPHLEIFADDVKASHGATVGRLDESHLLYLQTRGIPQKEGKKLLMEAFMQEVIEKGALSTVKDALKAKIRKKLK